MPRHASMRTGRLECVRNARASAAEEGRVPEATAPGSGASGVASDAAPAGDAIDRAYLSRFTLGNADLEREVLELFVAQLPVYLEQLRSAHDAKSWRDAAHSIKGSAAAVGARRLSAIARIAEQVDAASVERERAVAAVQEAADEARRSVAGLFAAA